MTATSVHEKLIERLHILAAEPWFAGGTVSKISNEAADAITTLQNRVGELERVLEPFSVALGTIADKGIARWPNNETIEHSGAAEEITWGDLRNARQALKGDA